MAHRFRLQENMEVLARKKQREFERNEAWKNKIKYYEHWDKQNSQYKNWTSPEYYENSLTQYDEQKKKQDKADKINERRKKLRNMLLEEEKMYQLEILDSPRDRKPHRNKEIPTDVLKEINVGLKIAEDTKKRHEAELKLYHKWRNENPIIKEYTSNQNRAELKMAWLDQQIEKRMAQEKLQEETKKMIENRDKFILEQQTIEKEEMEENKIKEKELLEKINQQMKDYKINESKNEQLKTEEYESLRKKEELNNLIYQREKELERRKNTDVAIFNLNQAKLKLRKKALEIQEQLKNEKQLLEEIEKQELIDKQCCKEEKAKLKESINSYLQHVKEQQKLEQQREEYISFIFDSEAKLMWKKQEILWQEEQKQRDKLLNNVFQELKTQIEDKLHQNRQQQKYIQIEKDLVLKEIEEADRKMKEENEELERRKLMRKRELEKQINDKYLKEKEMQMLVQKKKHQELENIRREEERIRNELMQLQRGKYHPARFNRKTMFW